MRYIQKLLTKRRMAVCTKCGFLGWQHISHEPPYLSEGLTECSDKERSDFRAFPLDQLPNDSLFRLHLLGCLALQWAWPRVSRPQDFRSHSEVLETVQQPRRCRFFIKYQAGYSPQDHKELKRDADTRRTVVKASLIGAVIGAASAIIAQFLYIYLTTPP